MKINITLNGICDCGNKKKISGFKMMKKDDKTYEIEFSDKAIQCYNCKSDFKIKPEIKEIIE